MRCVVQRVKSASVTVDGETVSSIDKGLLILVGISTDDTAECAEWMAKKLLSVKFFSGEDGKSWKSSVKDIGGEILLVSQFTLYFRNKGGNLDFSKSMPPDLARDFYQSFVETVQREYGNAVKVKDGRFGAMMDVQLVNDGPVTVQFEYPEPPSQKK